MKREGKREGRTHGKDSPSRPGLSGCCSSRSRGVGVLGRLLGGGRRLGRSSRGSGSVLGRHMGSGDGLGSELRRRMGRVCSRTLLVLE